MNAAAAPDVRKYPIFEKAKPNNTPRNKRCRDCLGRVPFSTSGKIHAQSHRNLGVEVWYLPIGNYGVGYSMEIGLNDKNFGNATPLIFDSDPISSTECRRCYRTLPQQRIAINRTSIPRKRLVQQEFLNAQRHRYKSALLHSLTNSCPEIRVFCDTHDR